MRSFGAFEGTAITKKQDRTAQSKQILKRYRYLIGIDTGVNTGIAIWNRELKQFVKVESQLIHEAMQTVKTFVTMHQDKVFIRVEDARLRTWFGNTGHERLKGAGSVERDARIWDDYLQSIGANFEMVHPKNNKTKTDAIYFKKLTCWNGLTNEHSRDAAMLVYGY